MGVKLREKVLSNGQVSFYLDIYHNKKRWYEFLEIHINKKKPSPEDKEKKRLANEIRAKRESELIVEDNGLIDKKKKLGDFVPFIEDFFAQKTHNNQLTATLFNLKIYLGARPVKEGNKTVLKGTVQPLPFVKITTQWLKELERWLLGRVGNNTTLAYMKNINGALNEAVRRRIIPRNPYHDVPKHERLRKKDVMRTAWSLEQLQQLADTTCNIDKQIKQGFFFSCFSGLRWSDVNCLRWREIKPKEIDGKEVYFIHFEQEKTEGIEYLQLTDQAVYILKERTKEAAAEGDKSQYVFPRLLETDELNRTVLRRVNYALKKWAKAAGLPEDEIHFHSSRHTFATNILEHSPDADLYTVQQLLGQKSWQSAQIYAKVRDKKKTAAIKGLPSISLKHL